MRLWLLQLIGISYIAHGCVFFDFVAETMSLNDTNEDDLINQIWPSLMTYCKHLKSGLVDCDGRHCDHMFPNIEGGRVVLLAPRRFHVLPM